MIRVTVWNENIHDRTDDRVKAIYPLGIHGTIARFLNEMEGVEARTATLDQPSCGLTDGVLDNTDVLIWWAHAAHHKVPDELAVNIRERVNKGMGFIALHSAHLAKPFKMLMGTSCTLRWREGDRAVVVRRPGTSYRRGVPACIDLEARRCTASFLTSPTLKALYSTDGSAAESCSARDAAGRAGSAVYFIFSRGTKPTRLTTTRISSESYATRCAGQPPVIAGRPLTVPPTFRSRRWKTRDRTSAGIRFNPKRPELNLGLFVFLQYVLYY